MLAAMPIPVGITRAHVLDALRQLDAGVSHDFGGSTKYDLVHGPRRYPPKAVIGLAAEVLTGRRLDPSDFSGGEAPGQANYVLRSLRFEARGVVEHQDDAGLLGTLGRPGEVAGQHPIGGDARVIEEAIEPFQPGGGAGLLGEGLRRSAGEILGHVEQSLMQASVGETRAKELLRNRSKLHNLWMGH